ncbi:hypothetical protein GF412_01215 [Candidatus Micrarchaeota archaeon]|nr:hypothetical protein [Candidatus Micrarchaeota archaeon]MBD3417592.1 hypothetical protein [Candidatus Micrarchaeota archaeon]
MARKTAIVKGSERKSIVPAPKGELSVHRNPVAAAAETFALRRRIRGRKEKETREMFSAAKKKKWGTVLSRANRDNINERGPHGMTLLMEAASQGEYVVVQRLVQSGAYKRSEDDLGRTAIAHALLNSHNDVAKLINSLGASWERDLLLAVRDRRVMLVKSMQEALGVTQEDIDNAEAQCDPGRGPALGSAVRKVSGEALAQHELTVMFQPKGGAGAESKGSGPSPGENKGKKKPRDTVNYSPGHHGC